VFPVKDKHHLYINKVPGSIPGAARLSEYQWVWDGVHSALVWIKEELLIYIRDING
jgi:hypothetical protein